MNCLLIDVGSTFIKYGVFDDTTQHIILEDKTAFPAPCVDDGKNFLVPACRIREKIASIFSATEKYYCKKAFFSVQMHGYLLRKPDNSFTDYVSWRDKSGDITDSRFQMIDFSKLGTSLKKNLPLAKLAFRNPEGELFTLGSYISWVLTGVNATHVTDACPTGFYFADTGLCNGHAGSMVMPQAHTSVKVIGRYRDIMIYTPIGDHQVSFLGSGAGEDKYLLNIGTATQISCIGDVSSENNCSGTGVFPGKYEARPYFDGGKRLCTVTGLIGGAELFLGGREDAFLGQVSQALEILPRKDEILLGGGGAQQIYSFLKEHIKCTLIQENIGMEGLKIVATENRDRIKVGTMLSEIAFPNFPIIAKNSGLDFIIIDNEHGYFDYSAIAALIMNANLINLEVIVRIGDNSRSHITKLADMGVKGFLLPMTNCREDIREVVKYAKYAPIGKRGVSTTRAHTLYNPPGLETYMKIANKEMKIYAQIETKNGVENIRDIPAEEGVDGIFIGPNDLSVDLDCFSDKALLLDCIRRIASAAEESDKPWGIITGDKELLALSRRLNVNNISCGSELNMLINGCKKIKEMV